jgi:hypothetical protein
MWLSSRFRRRATGSINMLSSGRFNSPSVHEGSSLLIESGKLQVYIICLQVAVELNSCRHMFCFQ